MVFGIGIVRCGGLMEVVLLLWIEWCGVVGVFWMKMVENLVLLIVW